MVKKSEAHETLSLMFVQEVSKHSGNGWSKRTGYG